MQRQALDEPRLTLADLAKAAGVSRGSVARYRLRGKNRIKMPGHVAQRLGGFLRAHGRKLIRIADELEAANK